MNDDAFNEWWNGLTGFSLNSERCLSDIQHHSGTIHPERLTTWMKSCWNAALDTAINSVEDDPFAHHQSKLEQLKAKFS